MKCQKIKKKEYLCCYCWRWFTDIEECTYLDNYDNYICPNCALKAGIIDAMEWMRLIGFEDDFSDAHYHYGEITATVKPEKQEEYGCQFYTMQIFPSGSSEIVI